MTRQYIGARYVPKFSDPVEWVSGKSYEALTIVTYLNNSYTSKIPVPSTIGNPADNEDYWAATGNYNAQVENYRQMTENLLKKVNYLVTYVTPELYGAKGDGNSDDSDAIQSAIDSGLPVKFLNKSYAIYKTINLTSQVMIIGDNIEKTNVIWFGYNGGTMFKTIDYPATADLNNTYGYIENLTFTYPSSKLANGSRCLYVCEPNINLTNIVFRMGKEELGLTINDNTCAIELDGCSNRGVFTLNHVSCYGQFEKGFYIRTSHIELISCDCGYGKYGFYIDNDSQNSSACPPYNVNMNNIHAFYVTDSMIYINKATSVGVYGSFCECPSSVLFIKASDYFTGILNVVNAYNSMGNGILVPKGSVNFNDTQNNRNYSSFLGKHNNLVSKTSRKSLGSTWGGSNKTWCPVCSELIREGSNGMIDITLSLKAWGSGPLVVNIYDNVDSPNIGEYETRPTDELIKSFSINISTEELSATPLDFHFLLSGLNWGNERHIFYTVHSDNYVTIKDHYLKIESI